MQRMPVQKIFLSFDYEYKILILVVQFILIFSKTKIKNLMIEKIPARQR